MSACKFLNEHKPTVFILIQWPSLNSSDSLFLSSSMSKSFGQSFCIDKSKGLLAIKVFSSWDFKVSKKSSVRLQRANIGTQLKVRTRVSVCTTRTHTYHTLQLCYLCVCVCRSWWQKSTAKSWSLPFSSDCGGCSSTCWRGSCVWEAQWGVCWLCTTSLNTCTMYEINTHLHQNEFVYDCPERGILDV